MRSRFRHGCRAGSPWLLGAWTLAWVLAVLQPCCEPLAPAVPHAHGRTAPATAGHGADAYVHAPAIDNGPARHRHCAQGGGTPAALPPAVDQPPVAVPDPCAEGAPFGRTPSAKHLRHALSASGPVFVARASPRLYLHSHRFLE